MKLPFTAKLPFIARVLLSVAIVFAVVKISHYYLQTVEKLENTPSIPWQYKQLNLDICSTTLPLIKSRFREMALIHHPDKGGSSEAWKKTTEARDFLLSNHEQLHTKYCKSKAKILPPKPKNKGSTGVKARTF